MSNMKIQPTYGREFPASSPHTQTFNAQMSSFDSGFVTPSAPVVRRPRRDPQISACSNGDPHPNERLEEADRRFVEEMAAKDAWPVPLPDPRAAYQAFRERTMELSHTLVCACCACLSHDSTQSTVVRSTYAPLSLLAILPPARVGYDFSCGVATIDQRHIMLQGDAVEMLEDGGASITLCLSCKAELDRGRLPKDALANRRWVGKVPKELEGLTWLEERLVARAHASGGILRLQRGNRDAYMGIKGHMVVCPQDTRELLDILPLPPSRLPDYVRVVWTGALRPTPTELNSKLSVRTARVYGALLWLCAHNEDYEDVTIDHSQFDTWPPVFVVAELIDSMGHISDNLAETIARTGAATENDLEDAILDDEITSSGMLDVNDVTQSLNSGTLNRLATLTNDSIVNVVKGSVLKSQYDDPAYFTACFPTIFPYGSGKHLDRLRTKHLSLEKWISLLLRHCSRRFQSNAGFVVLCFDVSRRQHTIVGGAIQTKSRHWGETEGLLNSLTTEDLLHAAQRAKDHQPLENPAVKSLLHAVSRIGSTALGSDARKFHMFSQLQSSVVRFGFPVIYLTLNPAEKCSPLALSYAGVEIDISDFQPEHYNLQQRMKTMLDNPLAVVEYFHTTVDALLKTLLKDSLFGTLTHHFGTIEYQGRGSPHIHLLLWLSGTTTPQQIREKASADPLYCTRLLEFICTIACECLPAEHVDVERGPCPPGERTFLPFLDPSLPDFSENMDMEVSDIVRHRQVHSKRHTATCFKRDSRECRFRFPRQLVEASSFDPDSGVVKIQRDDCWLNGFNPWISLTMRTNHDVQFLLTKDHAIAIMYYIIKYISKDEQSLHSKLAIAAAVRASQLIDAAGNTAVGKQMIQRFYNKIQSHREVGLPEAVSHLLRMPDHYTSGCFVNINTTQLRSYFKQRSPHSATTHIQGVVEGEEMVESEITKVGSQYKLINAFDDYNYRGLDFAQYSLYEYSAMYHKSKGLQGFPFTPEHMQHRHCSQVSNVGPPETANLLGALFYLNRASLDTSIRSDFFCILTALFVPWAFDSPVKGDDIGWEEHFLVVEPMLPARIRAYISNIELLHKSKEESIVDRLQRPQLTDASYHYDEHEELTLDFNTQERSPETMASFEATADAIRSFQNTIDLYTTEAVDASQEYGYVGATADVGDMDVVREPALNVSIRSKAHLKASITASKVARTLAQERHTGTRMRGVVYPSVDVTEGSTESSTQTIVAEFSLNEEQRRAFTILTDHASRPVGFPGQLLMGIFGEGGTGKSRLIDAIRAWFDMQDRGEELMVTAMTGSAASHIGGSTLHSATGIRVEKGDRAARVTAMPKKAAEWCNKRYLIIDEVSMIDRDIVVRLEVQLQLLTSNAVAVFGGMNILFCGDFLQFPCCSHLNVYDGDPDLIFSKGHDLWRSLNAGVILRQQMRQSQDPVWAALLHRLRMRCPTDEDIELLISRIGAPLTHTSPLPPAIIVRRHTVRTAINNCKIKEMSAQCNVPITYCVADIVGKTQMHHQEIYEITYPKSKVLSDAVLALVPGVPLMLTKNVDIPLGLTNGAIVEFVGFAGTTPVNPGDTISPSQHMLLVRVDPKYSCNIEGLPHNVFALDWERFTYYTRDGRNVTLRQFGVVLAFAITDYKCQGQTFYSIVVDLRRPVGFASTASFYVQLSRCRTLAEVSIIRSFDPAELRRPHPQALLAELDWQESLDRESIRNFGGGGI